MHCPKCDHQDSRVIETRSGKNNKSIRRRRECPNCSYRFSTIEEIRKEDLMVKKNDGQREPFDRNKILNGIKISIRKRPVALEQVEMLIADVCDYLEREFDNEIPSAVIGEAVMKRLKSIDQIAYVRYASVYKDFRDLSEMEKEIQDLSEK